jgi:predicted nucleotidyltransferase
VITPAARRELTELVRRAGHATVLLGAAAIRHASPRFLPRITDDLDLVIAVEVDALASVVPPTWVCHGTLAHRWFGPSGTKFDLVPSGPAILAAGVIRWPDGQVMNAAALDLALAHHQVTPASSRTTWRCRSPRSPRSSS